MTIDEILNIIHKEQVELEVFQSLSDWMVKDRATCIDKIKEQREVIRLINKVASYTDKKAAIKGVKNLCLYLMDEEADDGNSK